MASSFGGAVVKRKGDMARGNFKKRGHQSYGEIGHQQGWRDSRIHGCMKHRQDSGLAGDWKMCSKYGAE